MSSVMLRPLNLQNITFQIVGTSSLIQHAWAEKGLRELRMTKAERALDKKKNPPKPRDPAAEMESATHRMADGSYGVPVTAIKSALISAAHKDLGIEKTAVRKALFLQAHEKGLIRLECSEPVLREDIVRIGMGSTDIRYRPEFMSWQARIEAQVDADILPWDVLANLVHRAGFGCGIGEWRPEKGGDHGRFDLDREFKTLIAGTDR